MTKNNRSEAKPARKRSLKDLGERMRTEVKGGGAVTGPSRPSSDRPTEEVAFYYNKIAFSYATSTDGK
jgi:hypothetical protein